MDAAALIVTNAAGNEVRGIPVAASVLRLLKQVARVLVAVMVGAAWQRHWRSSIVMESKRRRPDRDCSLLSLTRRFQRMAAEVLAGSSCMAGRFPCCHGSRWLPSRSSVTLGT